MHVHDPANGKADICPFCFSLLWSGALGDLPVAFRLAKARGVIVILGWDP